MTIEVIKIRARVEVGGITCETPYIQSFNVRKERGKVSTFDATLKVPYTSASDLSGGDVRIYAGQDSASNLIFTGMCRAAKVSPCYNDPQYVILSVSGADKLSLLQGKKFTRRCRATNATWCAITSVVRPGLKSGKFAYGNNRTIELNQGQPQNQRGVVGTKSEASAGATQKAFLSNAGQPALPVPEITIYNTAEGGP